MNLKLIKLVNGEEILSEITEQKVAIPNTLQMKNPVRITPQQTQEGVQIALVPWLMFSKRQECAIPESHIMFQTDPAKDVEDAYCKQFNMIQVAPAGSIPNNIPGLKL